MSTFAATDVWLGHRVPRPKARLRLFCFPYAGSGASVFHTWPAELPADIEVCPVQLPGREKRIREVPCTDLRQLVDALTQVFQPLFDKPFAFFGHSLGALISFELARQLRRQGQRSPQHLFVAARPAPQLPSTEPPIHQFQEEAFVAEVCRRFEGIPPAILREPELMQLFVPILRADFALVETYCYRTEAPLECPISVFGGIEDRSVQPDQLQQWSAQTATGFSLRMLEGNHFFLQSARTALLKAVCQDLSGLLT